jgi:Mn-dependent DtxR family transcriptional regulator
MGIHESGENYLETILLLEKRNGSVRSIEIASELEFSKPSISRAMGILKKTGYITMEKNGDIHLTEQGRAMAERVYERHRLIGDYLIGALGVDREIAAEDACRIEHVISEEAFDKIKAWVEENRP